MKIRSMGIIDGKIVEINWADGRFLSTICSVGDFSVDMRIARLMQDRCKEPSALSSEKPDESLMDVFSVFSEVYDRRLSVHVIRDEEKEA